MGRSLPQKEIITPGARLSTALSPARRSRTKKPFHANAIGAPAESPLETGPTSQDIPMTSLTTRRPLVLAAVMAANFMIAIEATIVSTAMPQIVGQLGGLPLYSWVFAAFLLTQTATTVV